MARHGPPPKPTEVKRRLGNPGKRPLPKPVIALAPIIVIEPDPPHGSEGTAIVQAILDAGASTWVANTDRLGLLAMLAQGIDERNTIREEIEALHDDRSVYATAELHDRRTELRALEKQITQWLSLLGLTPTDRSHLGVAEVRARTKLEEIRARREAGHRAG